MRRASPNRNQFDRLYPIKPDVEPAPKPWPFAPALAVIVVLGFLGLQILLPATHYRHPRDPHRNWIPIDNKIRDDAEIANAVSDIDLNATNIYKGSSSLKALPVDRERLKSMHIFVWTNEPDLRPLAVVMNSTISNAVFPENINFHFVVPKSLSTVGYFRLKSFFTNVNIEMTSVDSSIENMREVMSSRRKKTTGKDILIDLDFLPFYLPKMYPNIERFICLNSDIVLQGRVEELFQMDMQGHAIAAGEDCSHHFDDYFDFELLEIARQSEGKEKPLMPVHPFVGETCALDQSLVVVDSQRLIEQNLSEAIEWWMEQFDKTNQGLYRYGISTPPALLTLYQNYQKLDSSWNIQNPLKFHKKNGIKVIQFKTKNMPWHMKRPKGSQDSFMGLWWNYLSPLANEMLKPAS